MSTKKDISGYVADVFAKRLEELGLTRYRFLRNNPEVNQPTLARLLYGRGGTSINTVAYYADLLGMEIRIVPKEEEKENETEN